MKMLKYETIKGIKISLLLKKKKKLFVFFVLGFVLIASCLYFTNSLLFNHTTRHHSLQHETISDKLRKAEKVTGEIFELLLSDPAKAREIAFHTLELIGDDNIFLETEILKHIGSSYSLESNIVDALKYYSEALSMAEEINSIQHLADINNNIGITNRKAGNLINALIHFFKATNYYEMLGDDGNKTIALNNIGLLYLDLNNIEKAKKYFVKALEGFTEIGDTVGMSSAYSNISLVYLYYNDINNSLEAINTSIQLAELSNNLYTLCLSYASLGEVYLSQSNPEKAIEAFIQSKNIAELINMPVQYGHAQLGIAKSLALSDNNKEALNIAMEVIMVAEDFNSMALKKESHRVLSFLYNDTEDYEKSLAHYIEYVKIKEELLNQAIIHQIYDFKLDNLSQVNKLQQLELERKELTISKNNNLLLFIILIFISITSGLYLYYLNRRNKQKLNFQQAIIELTKRKSYDAIKAEIQERKRIGQELHDSLGQLLSAVGMNISVLYKNKELSLAKRDKLFNITINNIDDAFNEVRNISHNLAPSLLSERGLEGALQSLSDQINHSKKLFMDFEAIGVCPQLNSLTENVIFRAVQEILNNTIKHSQANTLTIQLLQGKNEINLLAEDDGVGFDVSNTSFQSGSGLIHMRTRIENLNGHMHIDSSPNRGTIINVLIPLNNSHYEQGKN